MAYGKAEDAGGLSPAKDDNAAVHYFIRRTLPILDRVDYRVRETLNKSPRTSWRQIFRPSALQTFEIHKVFLHFCALTDKKSARQVSTR